MAGRGCARIAATLSWVTYYRNLILWRLFLCCGMFAVCLRFVAVCCGFAVPPCRAFVWRRSETATARKPYKHTNKKRKKQNQPTNPSKKPPSGGFTVQNDRPKSSWQHQGMRHQLVTQCLQNCVDIIQARVAFLRKRTLQPLSGHANFFGNS